MTAIATLASPQTSPLCAQILDAFPSGAYALAGLLRLLDIVETDAVATAAVECRLQPRLLINPDFVRQHAATPEKLIMLVMHELHHVLLGHTTLFPRATPVQNFVFDAVINGVLCRMFSAPAHTAFFTDYYSSARFPECLLRPPPGWPGRAVQCAPALQKLPQAQLARIHEVHCALYSAGGASYQEVFELLPRALAAALSGRGGEDGEESGAGSQSSGGEAEGVENVPLLGDHASAAAPGEALAASAPLVFDIVRELVEQWPQPPDPIRGRSLADVLRLRTVQPARAPSNRALLGALLRKIAGPGATGPIARRNDDALQTFTPVPSLSRRFLVLHALGARPLLHQGAAPWPRRVRAADQVHVYLDVSASMDPALGALFGAVLDCQRWVHPKLHLFSSQVADASLADLRAGRCRSTGGTDIACVAEHMARHRIKRALLVTDGWVGAPRGAHLATLASARLGVAYLGDYLNQRDLHAVARHTCILATCA